MPEKKTYTVSELNNLAKNLLETEFCNIWLEGEISNLATPASGHVYFSLKDERSQIKAAMFRSYNRSLKFRLEAGMQVLVRAKVSLYPVRGDYQAIVDKIEPIGDGALAKAFLQIKDKLNKQGLFASMHKKPISQLPEKIGVITSATGAAIHDVLTTLARRFPLASVVIYPTAVQGGQAEGEIVEAIQNAQAHNYVDTLLLVRGGGSLEDLWCFNTESVAKAIFNCPIPIITGVGHEVDYTIADYVADLRAPTPTAAAENATPNINELIARVTNYAEQLSTLITEKIKTWQEKLLSLQRQLIGPEQKLQLQMQRLDELQYKLITTTENRLKQQRLRFTSLHQSINQVHSENLRNTILFKLRKLDEALHTQMAFKMHNSSNSFRALCQQLDSLSPLKTLDRGYAIVRDEQQKVLTSIQNIACNDQIAIELKDGSVDCLVTNTISKGEQNAKRQPAREYE